MAEVELIMPKMGESIIEATIINWLKQEGDSVSADETVLEVATDKVDSEVPTPVSGTLIKILHQKDEVVAVGAVLAIIEGDEQSTVKSAPVDTKRAESAKISQPQQTRVGITTPEGQVARDEGSLTQSSTSRAKTFPTLTRKSLIDRIPSNVDGRFYSPLVRNISRAEGISVEELNGLKGSGADGRVTKFDLLNYIDLKKLEGASLIKRQATTLGEERLHEVRSTPSPTQSAIILESNEQVEAPTQEPKKSPAPKSQNSGDEIIELSRVRKMIAGHMRNSLDTAAHVTTVVEADATKLVQWRNRVKNDYLKKYDQKMTFSPLFTEAVIKALRDYPQINGSISGDQLIVKKAINIGIATAMENGNLIVPIIHDAGDLNINGLAKKLNDLTARARINKLKPAEIQGGTFTISNIGTFGNIIGTPIINQPELAVLALGAIKKKPVIQETSEGDIIAIRPYDVFIFVV